MTIPIPFLQCLLLILLSGPLFAQRRTTTSDQSEQQPLRLHGSLLLQGIYPGFRVGLERPIRQTDYHHPDGRISSHQRAVLFYVGMYCHPGFHLNTFAGAEYIFRRVGRRGLITEFRPSLALSRTFLGAETYRVNEAGIVETVSSAGQFYAMPGLGFGIGKVLGKPGPNHPLACMVNLNLTGLAPYNGLALPTPTLEVGFRYQLSTSSVHIRHRIRTHQ
ncbi:hypothetical protein [Runella slithyformis]|uniref:DUF3575 domain-containing protein n=1 Tax=Runella slithyformis (strain ATCC 29530 / DSM 19594 / LMG 11500 / NCIMB 11436 / LSU 4) TaxID=761193 RepID=A0A7U4E6G1_RUNSL|nr:hypothetical protein [Runella slithyformis]AEI49169.1 hypothetical protein Runsl_2775 [Runella slithyformis DSM 19594]